MIQINSSSKILVIAAHPDDEILGCGGCISNWSDMGAEAHALILAEGLTSRSDKQHEYMVSTSAIENLRKNAHDSADIIGYQSIYFEAFPDNRMDGVELLDIVQTVSTHIERLQPDMVLTHHHGDLNIDHRITFQAVITACRPLASCPVKTIISFETPSATEWNFPYHENTFSPNIFVDVTAHIDKKLAAMNCYETEVRHAPHPRSPESLRATAARWGSVIEKPYAEALELIRAIP